MTTLKLFQNSSNGRMYAVGIRHVAWLTQGQFDSFNAAGYVYSSHTAAEMGPIFGAHSIPNNLVPATVGGVWDGAATDTTSLITTIRDARDAVLAKIDATHTS